MDDATYATTLEVRLNLQRKLERSFGVRGDGTFFFGVEQAFHEMSPVDPWGVRYCHTPMISVLRKLQTYSRTDTPAFLADAIVMYCDPKEIESLLREIGRWK
jgi:hypothetical protein